jgi:hypothetical protein
MTWGKVCCFGWKFRIFEQVLAGVIFFDPHLSDQSY